MKATWTNIYHWSIVLAKTVCACFGLDFEGVVDVMREFLHFLPRKFFPEFFFIFFDPQRFHHFYPCSPLWLVCTILPLFCYQWDAIAVPVINITTIMQLQYIYLLCSMGWIIARHSFHYVLSDIIIILVCTSGGWYVFYFHTIFLISCKIAGTIWHHCKKTCKAVRTDQRWYTVTPVTREAIEARTYNEQNIPI